MKYLSQGIGSLKTTRQEAEEKVSAATAILKQPQLHSGLQRNYKPKDEEGEQYPSESQHVRHRVKDVLDGMQEKFIAHLNTAAAIDWTNTQAKSDIVVGEETLLTNVPVTYLLFLEKQVATFLTLAKSLPTLDEAEPWVIDRSQDLWMTQPVETFKTKKVPRNHIKFEGNQHHAPQIETYHEDVVVGTWETRKISAALPVVRKNEIIARFEALQKAIIHAREQANQAALIKPEVGKKLWTYLFK